MNQPTGATDGPTQLSAVDRGPLGNTDAVLTAVAHAYIQRERMRRGAAGLTFPAVHSIVQEIFIALLFAAADFLRRLAALLSAA